MSDVSNQRVGFVGLGDQGGPMALAIVEAGSSFTPGPGGHNPMTPWAALPSSGTTIWRRLPAR